MLNKVLLNGRLVADVELNNYGKGKNAGVYTRFTLAVNDGKDENGESIAQFITCKAFNKTAELLEEYVKKGEMVTVVGKLVNNNWEDKDGNKHYSTEVNVLELDLLPNGKKDDKKRR